MKVNIYTKNEDFFETKLCVNLCEFEKYAYEVSEVFPNKATNVTSKSTLVFIDGIQLGGFWKFLEYLQNHGLLNT